MSTILHCLDGNTGRTGEIDLPYRFTLRISILRPRCYIGLVNYVDHIYAFGGLSGKLLSNRCERMDFSAQIRHRKRAFSSLVHPREIFILHSSKVLRSFQSCWSVLFNCGVPGGGVRPPDSVPVQLGDSAVHWVDLEASVYECALCSQMLNDASCSCRPFCVLLASTSRLGKLSKATISLIMNFLSNG